MPDHRYILTVQAKEDLARIAEYVAAESGLVAAEHVVAEFRECFRFLAEQPGVGHVREDLTEDRAVSFWAVFSYLIAYTRDQQPLAIVSIIHGARDPVVIRRHLRQTLPGSAEDEGE